MALQSVSLDSLEISWLQCPEEIRPHKTERSGDVSDHNAATGASSCKTNPWTSVTSELRHTAKNHATMHTINKKKLNAMMLPFVKGNINFSHLLLPYIASSPLPRTQILKKFDSERQGTSRAGCLTGRGLPWEKENSEMTTSSPYRR